MFCPYCGSKKTDGVDVCPVCGNVSQPAAMAQDDSEDVTRLIQENDESEDMTRLLQENVPQQGFQSQQNTGFLGQTQWENPQDMQPVKKSKKGLVIGLIIAAIVLIGGGVAAFLILRGGGSSSPEKASEKAVQAIKDLDAEAFADTLSDSMYDKLCKLIKDNLDGDGIFEYNNSSGSALKKSLTNQMDSNLKRNKSTYGILNIDYEVIGLSDKSLDDLDEYEPAILELFSDYEDVKVVEIKVTSQDKDLDYSETIYDICYKDGGRWYSSMVVTTVAPAIIKYSTKSAKASDLQSATTISTACSAALTSEDAYSEVEGAISDNPYDKIPLATAAPGEEFKSLGADGTKNDLQTFLNEVNLNLANKAPGIKYTSAGAAYWTLGIGGDGKPVVWLGTSEGEVRWMLQPDIDNEYE